MINTEKQDPIVKLMVASEKGGIENQEKQGQRQLVNSELLPVHVNGGDIQTLIDKGVVFGKPLKDDTLFCKCTLPEGWKKVATDHSMWSELRNEKYEVVATMFYKGAFYDRSAHININ